MTIEEIINSMTVEEKLRLLTGTGGMSLADYPQYHISQKNMSDGPHGLRRRLIKNCTHFPNLCSLASTWDTEKAEQMGQAIAFDCMQYDIDMILGPGINIKRTPLCGRNFEYMSEDPVLAGEMCAGYINGVQKHGVGTSLKHYAVNSQEVFRQEASADIDERTLREIYLKAFEIAVKKSNPDSIMCAYNKINAVWCAENPLILTEILKNEWKYDGFVVSDWGAVQNPVRSFKAGLDLQMPMNPNLTEELKQGLDSGAISMDRIDDAVRRVLKFVLKEKPQKPKEYNRDDQHRRAREIAADGIVLLKNEHNILPLTQEKYKKIAVIGEYAVNPLASGQGSALINQGPEYTDNPLAELQKLMPDTQFSYMELYKKREYSDYMLWPKLYAKEFGDFVSGADAVLIFVGAMESEDTEKLDKRSVQLNPNFEMVIDFALQHSKKVIVVLQTGSALVLGNWRNQVAGIVEMWLAGESAGGAIADVLCGVVNPSGKLSETFPTKLRTDMDYPGDGYKIAYDEKLDVGYRYYDKHPDEIVYPFGHGLSYTQFLYSGLEISEQNGSYHVKLKVKNVGQLDGAEAVQLYVSDVISTVVKPVKELKKFQKVFLKAGEEKEICFVLNMEDFEYYNVTFHEWIAENGDYKILVGSSSRDIRLEGTIRLNHEMPYTMISISEDMIG